ncbi:MAG: hypothetical protein ACJ764_15525 [Solirubrobacteraceae bacterium]
MRRALGSPLRIVLALAGLVLLLLVVAQLVLPSLAASSLRDRLSKSGRVLSVQVDAFPAITLLWHQADRVVVRMASYRSSTRQLSDLLSKVGDTDELDASVGVMSTGLLTVHRATLHKRGSELTARATVTEGDLRAAVPFLVGVVPVASGGGQLVLRGTANVLGITVSADATVLARDGELLLVPDVPFGTLATIKLFSNPALSVQAVSASPVSSGFALSMHARLR